MYITEQKQCTGCKQYLDISNYYYHKGDKNYVSKCKNCRRIDCKKYYNNNLQGTLNQWLKLVLRDSKKRANLKQLEHNLTKEWITSNLPEKCPVLGIKLSFTGDINTTPSLDRFNNNKGYTTDNVRIISFRANTLKNNATVEELEAIVKYIKNK